MEDKVKDGGADALSIDVDVRTLLKALAAERARRVEVEGRLGRTAEALGWFLHDERFRVAVGGNPNAVEWMLTEARAVHEEAATITKETP